MSSQNKSLLLCNKLINFWFLWNNEIRATPRFWGLEQVLVFSHFHSNLTETGYVSLTLQLYHVFIKYLLFNFIIGKVIQAASWIQMQRSSQTEPCLSPLSSSCIRTLGHHCPPDCFYHHYKSLRRPVRLSTCNSPLLRQKGVRKKMEAGWGETEMKMEIVKKKEARSMVASPQHTVRSFYITQRKYNFLHKGLSHSKIIVI